MKKFISMVMAAAMVVSLVPATAFAADCTVKVNDVTKYTKQDAEDVTKATALKVNGAQLQIKLTDADTKLNVTDEEFEIKLTFDGGKLVTDKEDDVLTQGDGLFTVDVYDKDQAAYWENVEYTYEMEDGDKKVTIKLYEAIDLADDDIVYININDAADGHIGFTSKRVGHEVTVAVSGDLGSADAKTVATVVGAGLTVDVDDITAVAEDDTAKLEDLTIETTTKKFVNVLDFKYDANGDIVTGGNGDYAKVVLTVSNGFELLGYDKVTVGGQDLGSYVINDTTNNDDDEIILYIYKDVIDTEDELVIEGLVIDSEDAKVGDVATIKVTSPSVEAVEVEVAKVVDQALTISVDEDEEVPVYWSGVGVNDPGLTSAEDHESVMITLEETVIAAYNNRDEVELTLPEGVYVVGLANDTDMAGFFANGVSADTAFRNAYKEGDEESFIFEKGVIAETETGRDTEELAGDFRLVLVADADFVGPVELGLVIDGEEAGSVTIAEFKAPFTVEAAQNDLIIDYRNTAVPTDIVIKEAEAGLWDDALTFTLYVEEIAFEGDPTVVVNEEESDMEVNVDTVAKDGNDGIEIDVKEESDDEAGVVTISGIELFMSRNLPAGAYDLELKTDDVTSLAFYGDELLTATTTDLTAAGDKGNRVYATVADVNGYVTKGKFDIPNMTVKEGFVNIITAGRDQDDASFTKKVVVPVGAMEIVAGEETVALDVPAYINAAGYTMLPVRAVAVALGINTNNVLWDQATKTVTILYGQRIITMTVGSKVINVNGSAIPASAAVEIVNGRTFLGLRDLATALGVVDITWDAATQTATLNGNQ